MACACIGFSYAVRSRVTEPEPDPESGEVNLKPCTTFRAIVAERKCLNVIVEERREPAGTGAGAVRSLIRPYG